jgi:DNA ligase-1
MQIASETISEGKNLGRANATTPREQARAEAESKWTLQKTKKGYVETIEEAEAGKVDALVEGGIFPMLADKFDKFGDRVVYPAFIQPKMDGHRCIGIVKDGAATLWSRTRKPITSMPHVQKALVELSRGQDAIFDGELYHHEYRHNFEQITKFIRPQEPVEGHEIVQLHIYDMPSVEDGFEVRNAVLKALFAALPESTKNTLIEVDTFLVDTDEEITLAFERHLGNGFEGAILRTRDGKYLSHPTTRSKGLLKLKKFDDAEFEIVDVVEGTGKFKGLAKFVCLAGNGETFEAVKNGPLSELKEYYDNKEQLLGKIVTVKFMGFTNKKKVPRHGRVLRFREDL